MKKKFVVFIDIDGTWASGTALHPDNITAVEKARREGHYIFFNTGRAKAWMDPEHIKTTPHDGLITGLGSLVEIGGKTVFESLVPNSFVCKCIERLGQTPGSLLICGEEKSLAVDPTPYFKQNNVTEIKTPEDFLRKGDGKVQKVEFFGKTLSETDMIFLKKELNVYIQKGYIECCPKSCTKADAMDVVLKYLGIGKQNSIAIGDSSNDIEMLQNAGIAVAMGNAAEPLKEIADFVSTECKAGGVAYAIENIVLNKKYPLA